MGETQAQKKKRKKQQLLVTDQVQEDAIQNAAEVTQALEELEKEGVQLDIQVCPKCKSPRIKRAMSTGGDMWAHLGMSPPSFECSDCGRQERVGLKATNKRLTVKEVELIREAMDPEAGQS